MKNIKQRVSVILSSIMICSSLSSFASTSNTIDFNEFGFKNQSIQESIYKEINAEIVTGSFSEWTSFASQTNVSLDKKWTITFSKEFNYSSIASVSIVKGNEFIPVRISKASDDKLVVFPTDKFSGNSNYSLRIVLNNGKKYKKDFTTKNENRPADLEPNSSPISASVININEKITGKLTVKDLDYYRVEIPQEGTLNLDLLSLQQKGLDLTLYSENYDEGSMKDYRNQSKGNLSEGVMQGVYYIKVNGYYNDIDLDYELELSFAPSEYKDDNAGDKFVEAKKINLNETLTGHIGYKTGKGKGNNLDYYKIEVEKEGTLDIDLLSLQQKGLDLALYGKNYDKGAIQYYRNEIKGNISDGLMPGTYYVRISGYYDSTYSPYELKVKYNASEYQNDEAGDKFVNAKKINLNEKITGHIGYKIAKDTGNYGDYYKIDVQQKGSLDINLTSLQQKGLDLYLYSENYDKGVMKYYKNEPKGSLVNDVLPGTYYIFVKGYYDRNYSPYELDVIFK